MNPAPRRSLLSYGLIALLALIGAAVIWLLAGDESALVSAVAPSNSRVPSVVKNEDGSASSSNETPVAAPAVEPGEVLPPSKAFAHRQELERASYEAAGEGVEVALGKLAALNNRAERAVFIRGMFARLAEGEPSAAFAAAKQLPNGEARETAVRTLFEYWWTRPTSLHDEPDFGRDYGTLGNLLASLDQTPDVAAEGARQLLEGSARAQLLGDLAGQVSRVDPQRALSYGAGLEGKDRAEFLKQFAGGWAWAQGDAAWRWSLTEPDAALRATLQTAVLRGWAAKDPAAAARRLPELTEAGSRKTAIEQVSGTWAGVDTRAAFAWAETLRDESERDAALDAIGSAAPVGIGAVLSTSEAGLPLIAEIVPGGAASRVPGLDAQTQIAAISDENGQLIETKGRDLNEIVGMLRGAAGTPVTVQIIPPGGTPADRRTVVLTRQQLLFKR